MWCVSSKKLSLGPKLSWITFGMQASLQSKHLRATEKLLCVALALFKAAAVTTHLDVLEPRMCCLCFVTLLSDGSHFSIQGHAWHCLSASSYLVEKSLGPIKALAHENTNKNRRMVSEKKKIFILTRPRSDLTLAQLPGPLIWWLCSPQEHVSASSTIQLFTVIWAGEEADENFKCVLD